MYRHLTKTAAVYPLTSFSPTADVFSPPPPPPHYMIAQSLEFDSLSEAIKSFNSDTGNSSSSGYNSPSSLASWCSTTNQRQRSSNSLNELYNHFGSTREKLVDPESGHVRRVCSTGDLHKMKMGKQKQRELSPLSHESNAIIESMTNASKYTPQEKKERIERYKAKRNLRNFNKKIKYACRKTLADSRPRIRGRFAKNDEIDDKNAVQVVDQWSHLITTIDLDDDDDYWVDFLDAFSANHFLT